jgi:hypothetical protein
VQLTKSTNCADTGTNRTIDIAHCAASEATVKLTKISNCAGTVIYRAFYIAHCAASGATMKLKKLTNCAAGTEITVSTVVAKPTVQL